MIVHCTQKLAKKLTGAGVDVSASPLTDSSRLGSWHANLYVIDRHQCVMFCHDQTRFALFMPGLKKKDFANLDYWFSDIYINTLLKAGYPPQIIEATTGLLDELQFDTHCDRSVQGTLRTVRAMDLDALLMRVANVMELPLYSTSVWLNERPVTTRDRPKSQSLWPKDEMAIWLAERRGMSRA